MRFRETENRVRLRKNSERVLITGASGFIGEALFSKLQDMDPVGIYFKSKIKYNSKNLLSVDLRDENQAKVLFHKYSPKTIFHFAALTSPKRNEENVQLARELHLQITNNIVSCISKDEHIIFLSTDKVFDGSQPYPDEESETNPQWLYGKLKLECENIIRERVKRFHILRLPIVHSVGDCASESFIDKAIVELKAGRRVEVFNNVRRCFVRLQELLHLLEALIHDTNYGIYHVGSMMMSYYDRVRLLCEENQIIWGRKLFPKAGKTLPMAQNLDTNKLKRAFGYTLN